MPQAVADVLQHLTMLPPFSQVTSKLLVMLGDDSVSIDELNSVISADPSLVSNVIHLANSPFYMVVRPVETVKDALFVLGLSSIKNIVAGLSVQRELTSFQPRTDVFNMLDFWKHSYATAIVARKLGCRRDRKFGDTMYLTGLIHDVGKMILARHWPELWRAIIRAQSISREPYYVVEARMFAHSHAKIASELFRSWRFPTAIAMMVEHHHSDELHGSEVPGARDLKVANMIANAAGFSFPSDNREDVLSQELDGYEALSANLKTELDYQLRALTHS